MVHQTLKTVAGILLGMTFSLILVFQAWQLWRFISAGPRFTAADGQALCERVAAMEQPPMPCHYEESGR